MRPCAVEVVALAQVGHTGAGPSTGARRARLVARGAFCRPRAVVALVVALLAVVVGVALLRAPGAFELERADPAEAAVEPRPGVEGEGEGADDEAPPADEPEADGTADARGAQAPELVVHVDGLVAAPGVYRLPEGSRVDDAVRAAGGLLDGADTGPLNLAASLRDGEKVHVPAQGEAASPGSGPASSVPAGPSGQAASGAGQPVDINRAGVEELCSLPGVGEATARAIIEEREKNGPFSTPEDLMRVSGIGEKRFERMRELVRV